MKRWTTRRLLWLYPRAWRRRYGDEFAALLAQQSVTFDGIVDIVRGAYDAHRMAADRHGVRMAMYSVQDRQREERMMARRHRTMLCSFCGKNQHQAQRLIAGPNRVYICDECIHLCNEILAEATPVAMAAKTRAQHHALAPWWRRGWGWWQARTDSPDALGQAAAAPL